MFAKVKAFCRWSGDFLADLIFKSIVADAGIVLFKAIFSSDVVIFRLSFSASFCISGFALFTLTSFTFDFSLLPLCCVAPPNFTAATVDADHSCQDDDRGQYAHHNQKDLIVHPTNSPTGTAQVTDRGGKRLSWRILKAPTGISFTP